ncbi:MAG: hypothetical protein WC284_17145 [Candidimonas sp.]
MNNVSRKFIDRLVAVSPTLSSAFNETVEYWEPETPPVTIAFAELGQSVFENFETLGPARIQEIMAMIEEGIASDDDELSTAVATGFIEAVVGQASKVEGDLERVLPTFGRLSRSHAEAWIGS